MSILDPVEQNINGVTQLVGSRVNKINTGGLEDREGVQGELVDEFELNMSDEELFDLAKSWEGKYRGYEAKIKLRQQANLAYYMGKQLQGTSVISDIPIAANLIFEAEETFLPAALSKNPEPVVWSDNTTEGVEVSNDVKTMLQYHASTLVLRRKLQLMTRHWSIYFLGIIKHGWNEDIKEICSDVIDPTTIILDPNACIDPYGDYDGEYLGERKTVTADKLSKLFPRFKGYITAIVDGKMGTDVVYTEWWTNKYCFYTFKEKVLDKSKNPHFNYDKEGKETDEDGVESLTNTPGINHFAHPKIPYTFLSVFSLGTQPHDITGLIEQNIPNQNRISKRESQIDLNLDRSNNSIGFSSLNFNQEDAKTAATAMSKGHPILIPGGNINEAVARFPAPPVPDAFFKASEIDKQDLRSIFGTDGLGTTPPDQQKTLGGLLNNEQHDSTRIGGGIGDSIEQVASNIFNWWVQLYGVYYDEPHVASVMGQMKAVEYISLQASDLDRRIVVSVSPDSMKPKDELTEMNQAFQLAEAGFLDPKTLLTVLNFPDPQKTAESTVLWLMDKQLYLQINFPELAQKLAQGQQQSQGAPPQGQPAPEGVPSPFMQPSNPPQQ